MCEVVTQLLDQATPMRAGGLGGRTSVPQMGRGS
jgi:hypothetical protein